MSLKILINGAGVAGPALAAMLLSSSSSSSSSAASASYTITVVERAPALRTGGQQIDLRAQGIPIMKRLGLLAAIKEKCVDEAGIAFVDTRGKVKAMMGKNDSGQGPQGLTSEYEIMRGDLVDVMYEASLDAAKRIGSGKERPEVLKYEFGKYATDIVQHGDSVDVTFSDGTTANFDLVIGADGQSSRTRRMVFGTEASEAAFHSLGVYNAYFNIPRDPAEVDPFLAKMCHVPGKRALGTRTGNKPFTQVGFTTMAPSEKLTGAMSKGIEEQKAAWEELFLGVGWKADRLLDSMKTTDDFYSHVSGQVKLEKWHKGRVVLLGDAGYCPSPNTGMGTTAAFVGCYVLAGELAKHGADVDAALQGYESTLRPFINEVQKLPWGMPGLLYYETQWGIWIAHFILATFTGLRIDKLLYKILPEDNGDWKVPDYPELNLKAVA